MKKPLHCINCNKRTPHTSRKVRSVFYDNRGQPEINWITVYTCDVCGRLAGT